MADTDPNYTEYRMERGWGPNEILDAGRSFLIAAELMYDHNKESGKNWLYIQPWHVVHHLAVLSTELIFKSMCATDMVSRAGDESGPHDDEIYSYHGHHISIQELDITDQTELAAHLSVTQWDLLKSIDQKFAGINIARGRYPHDTKKKYIGFPSGDDGRELAERWLELARSLSLFCT